jgi:tetratricopeptide (TPR) repeat protein
MIDQVAAAFDRQDYKTAAQLLKPLWQKSPEDPWVQLYMARLQEVSGKLEAAEATFRKLLRENPNPKVVSQARQGLQRLNDLIETQRQQAISDAIADPNNTGTGVLVLEPLSPEARTAVAPNFARIMKLDPYTARLHLPSRGWRLYRIGTVAEMQVYGQELRQAKIPAFWESLAKLQKIRVFRVQYLEAASPEVTVICHNEADQAGSLSFNWSEVAGCAEGMLPVFEKVVDMDVRNRLTRKEQTQDYVQICDLHLPRRNTILRFLDSTYQFQQGVVFDASQDGAISIAQTTIRLKWNRLSQFLHNNLTDATIWSDFTVFAETALDQLELIGSEFKPYIDLFRKQPTNWDAAFHLYSGLAFSQLSKT